MSAKSLIIIYIEKWRNLSSMFTSVTSISDSSLLKESRDSLNDKMIIF